MAKKHRVALCLGEVLCDLFAGAPGDNLASCQHLVPQIGGAPANVAVQLGRLGAQVQLLTAVGQDPLSERLVTALREEGVGTQHVRRKIDRRVGLTFIQVDADAERHFYPWREAAADLAYGVDDLPMPALRSAALLHRGTVSLRSSTSRLATQKAVRQARASGALVSVDVNLRTRMFPKLDRLYALARGAVRQADIVKATLEEAQALFGTKPEEILAREILRRGPALVMITSGAAGALMMTRQAEAKVASPQVEPVDATGAGDAFMGAALHGLLGAGVSPQTLGSLTRGDLEELGRMACFAGAQATTQLGATAGMVRSIPRPA